MPYVTTRDQTTLYYKDWGAGRPVILIHGWPLSSDTWDEVALALAESGLRAIAYDRRGFGRSSQPYRGYDYDTLADDLADVMSATDAKDAVIVGFSMGGGEVARYMSRHLGLHVSQAALISSIVPYMAHTDDNPHGVPQSVFDGMTAGIKRDRAHFFGEFFKAFFGDGIVTHPVSEEVRRWAQMLAMMAGLKPTLACANAFATTDFRQDLPAITVPTLIVHGTADKIVPIEATSRQVAQRLPHARVIEYDGAPHGVFASHKERLIADLLDFIVR